MKNILITLFLGTFLLTSCMKDNFEGPNASFFGAIIDEKTNEYVETDLQNGSTIEAYELGYEDPVAQKWVIKNNGEFRNNLVFANDYDLYLRNGNFYPQEFKSFKIKKGENEHNFIVKPYLRILDESITYDKTAKKIIAKFKLEGGNGDEKVKNVRLYAFSDMHVGEAVKFDVKNSSDKIEGINTVVDPSYQYELSIDLDKNPSLFKSGRNYFFRIGALANIDNVGTIRHNYAPYVKITLE